MAMLAAATLLGSEGLCARGFAKRWIGAVQIIPSGKKSGALSSFMKALAIAEGAYRIIYTSIDAMVLAGSGAAPIM